MNIKTSLNTFREHISISCTPPPFSKCKQFLGEKKLSFFCEYINIHSDNFKYIYKVNANLFVLTKILF